MPKKGISSSGTNDIALKLLELDDPWGTTYPIKDFHRYLMLIRDLHDNTRWTRGGRLQKRMATIIDPELKHAVVKFICLRKIQGTNSATPKEPTQETT